jgi:hypothetical protein
MSLSLPAQALKVSSWLLGTLLATVHLLLRVDFLLWLTHVRVEIVEVSQILGPESRVRVCRIVSLVMLNVYEHIVLLR